MPKVASLQFTTPLCSTTQARQRQDALLRHRVLLRNPTRISAWLLRLSAGGQ